MKGAASLFRRFRIHALLIAGLFLSVCKTPAPFAGGAVAELMSFTRTNATGGIVASRLFNSWHGPADKQRFFTGVRLVPTGAPNEWLGIEGSNIIRVNSAGEATIEPNGGLALNDSPVAVAFDTKRARVVLATTGGEGNLFTRSATAGQWSLLNSLNNVDLVSLVYDATNDKFVGMASYAGTPAGPTSFLEFSPDGVNTTTKTGSALEVNVGPGADAAEMVVGDSFGGRVILLFIERPYTQRLDPADVSRLYALDSATEPPGVPWSGFFAPHAPTIQITYPQSESTMLTFPATSIYLEGFDQDGDLQKVEFRDNGALLKEWTFDPLSYGATNYLKFDWTSSATGAHTFSARATDWNGASAETSVSVNAVIGAKITVFRALPTNAVTGRTITVQLVASPWSAVSRWMVAEVPPTGWSISAISDGGAIDANSGAIGWGPFDDTNQRVLTYQLTAPTSFGGDVSFHGFGAGDGIVTTTLGPNSINLTGSLIDVNQTDQLHIALRFNIAANARYKLEATDDLQSGSWTSLTDLVGGETPVDSAPIEISGQQQFYRLIPVE